MRKEIGKMNIEKRWVGKDEEIIIKNREGWVRACRQEGQKFIYWRLYVNRTNPTLIHGKCKTERGLIAAAERVL
jgi:hypothetical protein